MTFSKESIDQLAILGGPPLFSTELHVGRPNVLDRAEVLRLVGEAMDRGWLTNNGPLVTELEARFAAFSGVEHAVAVANATLGLQLVAVALGVRGEVIMPSFTFIGTAHALAWIGLRPVFADVLPNTHTLDPADVAERVTPSTGAIVGVHLWGGACDTDALQAVAKGAGIPLFFDAAHAVGSAHLGRRVGGFGRAEVFSLHATKAVNALEAGIITTNDGELADGLRALRNFGFSGEDAVAGPGINAKLNEFSAAMGISNLAHFEAIRSHNLSIHAAYRETLATTRGVRLMTTADGNDHSYHHAVLQIDESAPVSRDLLQRVLTVENVRARRYFTPGCHRSPPYRDWAQHDRLPVTDRLSSNLLQLPTGLQLDSGVARRIGDLISYCFSRGDEIAASVDRP